MSDKGVKRRTLWQMLMLAIILVGFPLGSWVYLTKGFNYQMAAREQLRKTDQLPMPDDLQLIKGELPKELIGSMYILTLIPQSDKIDMKAIGSRIVRLHEQFDEPKNIQFWTVFENRDSSFIANFIEESNIKDEDEQLLYFMANSNAMIAYTEKLGFIGNEIEDRGVYPQFVMVDDSTYVRRIFRADLENEVKQLVEVTALLLPERSKPKARVVRETEK